MIKKIDKIIKNKKKLVDLFYSQNLDGEILYIELLKLTKNGIIGMKEINFLIDGGDENE